MRDLLMFGLGVLLSCVIFLFVSRTGHRDSWEEHLEKQKTVQAIHIGYDPNQEYHIHEMSGYNRFGGFVTVITYRNQADALWARVSTKPQN